MYFGIFMHVMTFENVKRILFATYGIPFFILYGLYFIIYEAEILTKASKKREQAKIDASQPATAVPQSIEKKSS